VTVSAGTSSQLETTLAAARRSYAACPVAVSQDVLAPPFFWRVPVDEAERRFADREYGVYCGGNAWHLAQVLTSLGIEAFTFNFGVDAESGLTHVIVLARHWEHFLAVDPYYGHYLADGASGEPISFAQHLTALRGDGSPVVGAAWTPLSDRGDKQLLLGDPATIGPPGEEWLREGKTTVAVVWGRRLVLRRPPPSPWIEAIRSRTNAPRGAEACERGLLNPLSIADSSGQSVSLGDRQEQSPPRVEGLLRDLGFVIP
jgi:hypothetical protein